MQRTAHQEGVSFYSRAYIHAAMCRIYEKRQHTFKMCDMQLHKVSIAYSQLSGTLLNNIYDGDARLQSEIFLFVSVKYARESIKNNDILR